MNGFSDDILVAASSRGDKSAYAALVKRHYRRVFGVCLGVVGNVHDAEDIAQDALLKGFLEIKKLRRNERFEQWILRVAKNLSIDFLRRKRHVKALAAREVAAEGQENTNNNHDLAEAIRRLPQELRLPLVMYYLDNKSAESIAEMLDISHSGVCHRIRMARRQLHKLLTNGVHNEP
ncbi:MAG: RNA polymerase sigma factor [Planctomycetota bacterium]